MEFVEIQVVHVGRGVEVAQRPVQIHRRRSEGNTEALGGHDLHDVAGQNILLDPLHRVEILRLAEV